ncbi:hypothetical protein BDQ17DRAFT_1347184 [Cyathus striatus]|nr:hypothetical protein BDQ17DRAFT_1347184 [Cyathus striatus]
MAPKHIAVIGGGITGLSSAFHLSRRFPKTRITLLEGQPKLGGWIRNKRIDLPKDSGSVLLEMGPRTLRPNAKSLLELVHLLGLKDKLITVPKNSAAAKTRYLYIPRSSAVTPEIAGLQALPSSIASLLFSPLRSILLPAVLKELVKASNRPKDITDESLDSFLTRRFGETFAHTFGSALVHGIYAADSRNLSVRTAFPTLWQAEERGKGSVGRGFLMPERKFTRDAYEMGNIPELMRKVSVYSFKDGMETLSTALGDHLTALPDVEVKLSTKVTQLSVKDDGFDIYTQWGEHIKPSHIISCIPLPTLSHILSPSPSSDTEADSYSIPHTGKDNNIVSSVQVVNFVPGVLGTVFDSSSLYLQDTPVSGDYYTQGKTTKLTMMVGGPYPLPRHPSTASSNSFSSTDFPEQPELITALLKLLQSQLKRKLPEPVYWHIQENKSEMRKALEIPGMEGRLDVAGAYVDGVSVGDCVEAGRRAGRNWG